VAGNDFKDARLKVHVKQRSAPNELSVSKQRSEIAGIEQGSWQCQACLAEKDILAKPRRTLQFLFHACLVPKFVCYDDGTHLFKSDFSPVFPYIPSGSRGEQPSSRWDTWMVFKEVA
jgi:hypothetical protein